MIELFGLIHRLGGEIDLQLFEGAFVCLGENHAGMCFAAGKVIKLCEGIGSVLSVEAQIESAMSTSSV